MKKMFCVIVLFFVASMVAYAVTNRIQIVGNYNTTQNVIYIQDFQDSLVMNPVDVGSYAATWFDNAGVYKELIYITGKTPTVGLTPACIVATRGYNDSSKLEHNISTYMDIGVLNTYTPTPTFTATNTFTPTSTFTPTAKNVLMTNGAKVGATAGWVVNANDNVYLATLPASQTGSTLILPLDKLEVGNIIYGFNLAGQGESGGNEGIITAELFRQTDVATDITQTSLGASTPLTIIADAVLSTSNTGKTLATPETIAAGKTYYLKITATTNGSVDFALAGANVQIWKP